MGVCIVHFCAAAERALCGLSLVLLTFFLMPCFVLDGMHCRAGRTRPPRAGLPSLRVAGARVVGHGGGHTDVAGTAASRRHEGVWLFSK